jgi:protein-arginine kinase
LNCPAFPADEDKMINSTRIRVARNLAAYPLGTAVTRSQRLEIEKLVTSALGEMKGDLKGKYYSLANMSASEKNQLIADHFLFKGGDKYLQSAGLERDWPEARGIFHNDAKTFLVWVNEEDQLRIISMQKGSNIK